jgi:hypothetical protein
VTESILHQVFAAGPGRAVSQQFRKFGETGFGAGFSDDTLAYRSEQAHTDLW